MQTVIPHPDAPAQGDPVQRECRPKSGPAKEEESGDSARMKKSERRECSPVKIFPLGKSDGYGLQVWLLQPYQLPETGIVKVV
jgi:hypothetical protein